MSQNTTVELETISFECNQASALDVNELIKNVARKKSKK